MNQAINKVDQDSIAKPEKLDQLSTELTNLTFFDITERKEAEKRILEDKELAEEVIKTISNPMLLLSNDLRVQSANEAFYQFFDMQAEAVEKQFVYKLGKGQWNIPTLCKLLKSIIPETSSLSNYEVEYPISENDHRCLRLNARQINHTKLILLSIEDRAANKRAEQCERKRMAALLHDDLQQLLIAAKMQLEITRSDLKGSRKSKSLNRAIQHLDDSIKTTYALVSQTNPMILHEKEPVSALQSFTLSPTQHSLSKDTEEGESKPIRIVVVDDHPSTRDGVISLFRRDPRIGIAGKAKDGDDAIAMVERHRPDVVLMDVNMPRKNGIEATREIRRRWPETQVIALSSQNPESEEARAITHAGAVAFLHKSDDSEKMIATILALFGTK